MSKRDIRERFLKLRDSQTAEERELKSVRIQQRLFDMPEFIAARTVLFYVSTRSEVETEAMIRRALGLDKRVFVPASVVKERSLAIYEIKSYDELEPGAFGILEPRKDSKAVPPGEIDLAIVPGAVFDRRGNRIGYGMGFYDRFLKSLRNGVPVVALAYDLQIADNVPADPHDFSVHKIVTEKRIIECKVKSSN